MSDLKLLHIGQCSTQAPFSSLQQALMPICDYKFVSSSDLAINEKSIQISNEWKPDLVFIHIQAANVIKEETVIELKNNGAWIANWTGDARYPTPRWYYDVGKHIDLTLFSNEQDAIVLRENGVNAGFLQIGIDENIYTPIGKRKNVCDIAFMANNYNGDFPLSNYRKETADILKRKYKNKFGLFGSGWNKIATGNLYSSQLDEAAVYRGSKIGINISHFDLERYSSDRIFRIMGSGALCMCKEYPGYYRDFKDKENLVIWRDHKELIQIIDYYLQNESERKRIADNGCKLVHEKYTFKNTVETLLKYYHANI